MSTENHSLMDGKVQIYKRDASRYWQCSTYMDGRNHRTSTKSETLTMAKEFAREWYMATYVSSKHHHLSGWQIPSGLTLIDQRFPSCQDPADHVLF